MIAVNDDPCRVGCSPSVRDLLRWALVGAVVGVTHLILPFYLGAQPSLQPVAGDSLNAALLRARAPLVADANGWSGSGFSMISSEVRSARFVAIGEEHGFPQVSRFVAAVLEELRRAGRSPFLAVENGPWAMRALVTAARKDSLPGVRAFVREHPAAVAFAAPFELELYVSALRDCSSDPGKGCSRLWGLDQPFGATHVLAHVASEVSGNARPLALDVLERARSLDVADRSTRYLLDDRSAEELEALMSALGAGGQAELAGRVEDLHRSAEIYALHVAAVEGELTGLRSNQMREQDLKRRFVEQLETAETVDSNAAVVIKMGADHLYRGIGPTGVLTLGSFVSALATAEGQRSLHLAAFPSLDPTSLEGTAAEWAMPLMAASIEGTWTVVDLRIVAEALHAGRLAPMPEALERLIRGYDLLVLFPVTD